MIAGQKDSISNILLRNLGLVDENCACDNLSSNIGWLQHTTAWRTHFHEQSKSCRKKGQKFAECNNYLNMYVFISLDNFKSHFCRKNSFWSHQLEKWPERLTKNETLCAFDIWLPGLHKLWYPSIRDTSTWSKFGAHGEHGDVFLFSNLGALWFSENLIRYSLHVCLREVKKNLFP